MAPNFVLNHRDKADPYASRYGEHAEEEMAKSLWAKGHVCVKELVVHMIIETAKTFEGTTHEKYWLFFHDALSQLCDARTVKWMQETKDDHGVFYYDRWLIPANDLNAGTVFANWPTGDSPALARIRCYCMLGRGKITAKTKRPVEKNEGPIRLEFSR